MRKRLVVEMSARTLIVVLVAFSSIDGSIQGSWFNVMDSLVPIPVPRCQDVAFPLSQEEWIM